MNSNDTEQLLLQLCEKYGMPPKVFKELLQVERKVRHLKSRPSIAAELRIIIEQSTKEEKNEL